MGKRASTGGVLYRPHPSGLIPNFGAQTTHLERVRSLMLGEGCLVRCWAEALQPQRWRTFWQRLRVTASGPLPAWAGAENISF